MPKRPIHEMFEDVYADQPKHLKRQYKELQEHLAEYGSQYPLENYDKSPQ
jgi:hypothetical protein